MSESFDCWNVEIAAIRWLKLGINYTESDALRCFIDNAFTVCCPTGADSSDGCNGSHCFGCDLSDSACRSTPWIWWSFPAQLLLDVSLFGDVFLARAVLPEPFRGPLVYIVLAYRVLLRDRYAPRVSAEGVLCRPVRRCVYDAPVPLGIYIHAIDEHQIIFAAVVPEDLVCYGG